MIGNGGGLVYAPLGPTHQAIDDIALMRNLPNMTIISPCDAYEMEKLMMQTLNWKHPIYIRLAKGGDEIIGNTNQNYKIGKGIVYKEAKDGLFITTGIMAQKSLKAASHLDNKNMEVGLLHLPTVKPLDEDLIIKSIHKTSNIIIVEEHSVIGGLGSSILELISKKNIKDKNIISIGLPDVFNDKYGNQEELLNYYGLNSKSLIERMKVLIEND